ncbi:hypothetical protein AB5I41_28065 [Sphingomonas sp. MMS24-JH45]
MGIAARRPTLSAIADLNPASIADFGANSVLLDFSDGLDNPAIQFLGRALREECGMTGEEVARIADVPPRSLLSRLTDHYLQIIANRAPIGFEAEFVGTRGQATAYRGILMPFSSDGATIDFIYGVINWKELAAPEQQQAISAELAATVRAPAAPAAPAPSLAWADGPSAGAPAGEGLVEDVYGEGLDDRLAAARASAAAARAADVRSHAALYRALGRAHDFALAADRLPEALAALLDHAAIKVQARSPLTAIAKLVFGTDHDKTRLTEIAAVLSTPAAMPCPRGSCRACWRRRRATSRGSSPTSAPRAGPPRLAPNRCRSRAVRRWRRSRSTPAWPRARRSSSSGAPPPTARSRSSARWPTRGLPTRC